MYAVVIKQRLLRRVVCARLGWSDRAAFCSTRERRGQVAWKELLCLGFPWMDKKKGEGEVKRKVGNKGRAAYACLRPMRAKTKFFSPYLWSYRSCSERYPFSSLTLSSRASTKLSFQPMLCGFSFFPRRFKPFFLLTPVGITNWCGDL